MWTWDFAAGEAASLSWEAEVPVSHVVLLLLHLFLNPRWGISDMGITQLAGTW
jgi:hypothetical protein